VRLVTGGRDYWAVTAARLYLRFAAQKGCLRNQAMSQACAVCSPVS
jgi:hypothetical protein